MINKNLTAPMVIDEKNLSIAWAKAFIHIKTHAGIKISPLIISITGFDEEGTPEENINIRKTLDEALRKKNATDIETVAFTIFPDRLWKIAGKDRLKLYHIYLDAYPRYVERNRAANGRGLYFQRLITQGPESVDGNQLEWILSQYGRRTGVRSSMFQASIFNPSTDHTASALVQFPCLQHVSFVVADDSLVVNAFYATQQLFYKAYGNYLGLSRLGAFMAKEMGLKLGRLNVFIGVESLGKDKKSDPVFDEILEVARDNVGGLESED